MNVCVKCRYCVEEKVFVNDGDYRSGFSGDVLMRTRTCIHRIPVNPVTGEIIVYGPLPVKKLYKHFLSCEHKRNGECGITGVFYKEKN